MPRQLRGFIFKREMRETGSSNLLNNVSGGQIRQKGGNRYLLWDDVVLCRSVIL